MRMQRGGYSLVMTSKVVASDEFDSRRCLGEQRRLVA